ncbi:MAG: type III pantothenate kinase [Candidatus Omnitrophica bacterium]|nr:type III pantothenate kinase [Candidatus Omnitrophota bacterium]
MLLAVDIGNTSINNGIFEGGGGRLRQTFRISAYARDLKQQYARKLRPYLNKIECAMVVSVAPRALRQVEGALRKILPGDILVVGRDMDTGVKNRYKDPRQVGQDRLVNARAAYEMYGGPCVVVDFGTAITIDVINRNREYLGGVIAPGVEISLEALSRRAALLPRVNIKRPAGILGKETRQSMISGAVYGFSSLCDGIVKKLKKMYCRQAKVVATGGLSRLIGPYCETVSRIDPELTLKGLNLIFSGRD